MQVRTVVLSPRAEIAQLSCSRGGEGCDRTIVLLHSGGGYTIALVSYMVRGGIGISSYPEVYIE